MEMRSLIWDSVHPARQWPLQDYSDIKPGVYEMSGKEAFDSVTIALEVRHYTLPNSGAA
jgi:hypothetical protein